MATDVSYLKSKVTGDTLAASDVVNIATAIEENQNGKANTSDVLLATQLGAASGVAPLNSSSKINESYLPTSISGLPSEWDEEKYTLEETVATATTKASEAATSAAESASNLQLIKDEIDALPTGSTTTDAIVASNVARITVLENKFWKEGTLEETPTVAYNGYIKNNSSEAAGVAYATYRISNAIFVYNGTVITITNWTGNEASPLAKADSGEITTSSKFTSLINETSSVSSQTYTYTATEDMYIVVSWNATTTPSVKLEGKLTEIDLTDIESDIEQVNSDISSVNNKLGRIISEDYVSISSVSQQSAYIKTSVVGATMTTSTSSAYSLLKFDVSDVLKVEVTTKLRAEAAEWIVAVDADDKVIKNFCTTSASTTELDLTDFEVDIPTEAVYLYAQSYNASAPTAKAIKFDSINAITEDIDALNSKLKCKNEQSIDIEVAFTGAIRLGSSNTAPVITSYENYRVSNAISIKAGKTVQVSAPANCITVIAKVDSGNVTTSSLFTSLVSEFATNTAGVYTYTATEDMYIAICWWMASTSTSPSASFISYSDIDLTDKLNLRHYANVIYSGTSIKSGTELMANDVFSEGDEFIYSGTAGSGSMAIGFFDSNGDRISYVGYPSTTVGTEIYVNFTIPSGCVSVKTIWGLHKNIMIYKANDDSKLFISNYIGNLIGEDSAYPEFVSEEATTTKSRILEWQDGDNMALIPTITDVHTDGTEKYKHCSYVGKAAEILGADLAVNLGDIGLNATQSTASTTYANKLVDNTLTYMSKYSGLWLFCVGNHDKDLGSSTIFTKAAIKSRMQSPFIRSTRSYVVSDSKETYGYYDIPSSKLRIFYLDSSDQDTAYYTYYIYSKEQLQCLISAINSTPSGYAFVCFSHFCPNEIGKWASYSFSCVNYKSLHAILKAFANHTSGTSDADDNLGLTFDFSSVGANLAGLVCGDSHFDNQTTLDGVNYVISQGYGGVSDSELPSGAVKTSFSYDSQMLSDVVCIKPEQRVMKLFRIGAGGEGRDREFTF